MWQYLIIRKADQTSVVENLMSPTRLFEQAAKVNETVGCAGKPFLC